MKSFKQILNEQKINIISEYRGGDLIVQVGKQSNKFYGRDADIKKGKWTDWGEISQDMVKYIQKRTKDEKKYAEYYYDLIS